MDQTNKKWVGKNGRNVKDFGKVNEITSQKRLTSHVDYEMPKNNKT